MKTTKGKKKAGTVTSLNGKRTITAEEFDRLFEEGSDELDQFLDWSKGKTVSPNIAARGITVKIADNLLTVALDDGRVISTPLTWYPRLEAASPADRAVWEWVGSGEGIHWPLIDEDLSINGMLEGKTAVEYRKPDRR